MMQWLSSLFAIIRNCTSKASFKFRLYYKSISLCIRHPVFGEQFWQADQAPMCNTELNIRWSWNTNEIFHNIIYGFWINQWIIMMFYICNACKANGVMRLHYDDVIMSTIASRIPSLTTVYLIVYSRKHQSSASLAFVWGIHRGPVNSPHKGPATRKMFPFDDVIMNWINDNKDKGMDQYPPHISFKHILYHNCRIITITMINHAHGGLHQHSNFTV